MPCLRSLAAEWSLLTSLVAGVWPENPSSAGRRCKVYLANNSFLFLKNNARMFLLVEFSYFLGRQGLCDHISLTIKPVRATFGRN